MIRQELMGNRRVSFRDCLRIGPDGPQRIPCRILKLTCFAKVQARKPSFKRDEVVISRGKLQCGYNLFYKQGPCITVRGKKKHDFKNHKLVQSV
jgi:hypothetical protein